MKKSYLTVIIVNKFIVVSALFLTACGPSPAILATLTSTSLTAIAASWTKTPTPTPSPSHTPTIMPTPTTTPSPSNTPTPKPTNTPEYGTFSAPASIGMTIIRYSEGYKPEFTIKMAATVLEVKQGDAADKLAKTELDWFTYKKPIEEQEYLGIKIKLEVLEANPNEVYHLYSWWSLTLRYEEAGSDIWPVDMLGSIKEGYPPLDATTWVFFLIRTGTKPLLYFQPDLYITEGYGFRQSGAYFSLIQE